MLGKQLEYIYRDYRHEVDEAAIFVSTQIADAFSADERTQYILEATNHSLLCYLPFWLSENRTINEQVIHVLRLNVAAVFSARILEAAMDANEESNKGLI